MIMAWRQLTTSPRRNTPFSYWQLAGVHGKSWTYNGVDAPTSGFCRHQVPGFGPWHRAYLRQFELALLDAARTAASAITDRKLRRSVLSILLGGNGYMQTRLLTTKSGIAYQEPTAKGCCRFEVGLLDSPWFFPVSPFPQPVVHFDAIACAPTLLLLLAQGIRGCRRDHSSSILGLDQPSDS